MITSIPKISYNKERYEDASYRLSMAKAEDENEIKQLKEERVEQLEKRKISNLEKEKFKQSRAGVMVRKADAAASRVGSAINRLVKKRLSKPRRV